VKARSPGSRTAVSFGCIAAAVLAIVPIGLSHLRFARDDWSHYAALRDLRLSHSFWESLHLIITNEWFGAHELRIFFGAFVTHFLISYTGSAAMYVAYATQLTMHAVAGGIWGWIAWRQSRSFKLGACVSLALVYLPPVSQPVLWINNLFFVQNWFFLALSALAMQCRLKPLVGTGLFSLCLLGSAFSGESTLLAVVLISGVFSILNLRKSRTLRDRVLAVFPSLILCIALATYLALIVQWPTGPGSELNFSALRNFDSYLSGVVNQSISLVDPLSVRYGSGSVSPSITTLIISLLVSVLAVIGIYLGANDECGSIAKLKLLSVPLLGACCAIMPMALGVITGSRPGPDLRYLGFLMSCVVAGGAIIAHYLASVILRRREYFAHIVAVFALYSISVTTFNIIDVWGLQREVDARIWSQVDNLLDKETYAIVTFNPNHMYLMAPWHSNAVSDFQADWGVAGRIRWKHPNWKRVNVFRDATMTPNTLYFREYYNETFVCAPPEVFDNQSSVIYITYDYGPEFADLLTAPLLVTTRYEEYRRSQDEILSRSNLQQSLPQLTSCPD